MAELTIVREFSATREKVFAFVTQAKHLVEWWGPESMFIPAGDLDFTSFGPWYSIMENEEGKRHKVSGTVTSINPPKEVSFTWAWHDENDVRGDETSVQFLLVSLPNGHTEFTLKHTNFKNAESMGNHEGGWTSSLRKLERNLRSNES